MKSLYEILNIAPPKINIIDLGAREISPNEKSPFGNLPNNCIGKVFGFEPDAETCESLNKSSPQNYTYLPYAVFDGTEQNLFLTKSPLVSSLYEPDLEFRKAFGDLHDVAKVTKVLKVQTAKLDDISQIDVPIDFIKADVQGSECVIFANAKRILSDASVIQTEVFLIPLYKNMPLSGDVDKELNNQNFLNHRLWGCQGRTLVPLVNSKGLFQPLSQYTAQDVIYVRNWVHAGSSFKNSERILKAALILHDLYKSVDLVHYLLMKYDEIESSSHAYVYHQHLLTNSNLVKRNPNHGKLSSPPIKPPAATTDKANSPSQRQVDFYWLASYPRSGNTYLRTILWNCFGLKSGSIYPQDLGNNVKLKEYVGHIEHSSDRKINFPSGSPQLLKTHELPKNTRPAIYVVRDGRAACASLYRFYNGTIPMSDVVSGRHRFGKWSTNVEAWGPWRRENTLLLKYEDLRDDLESSLAAISAFLNRPILNHAIPSRQEIAENDGKWVRSPSSWKDLFDDSILDDFYRFNGDTMRRLGYECPALKVHLFDNGVKVYDHHLLDVQRKRYEVNNLHEPEEEEIFTNIICGLKEGESFIDVGAAVGYYIILAHQLMGSRIKITAFEPLPSQAERLEENLKLNRIASEDVLLRTEALSNKDGTALLTDASYASGIVDVPNAAKMRTVNVATLKVDTLLANNSDRIGLLQIDVQGHELSVLRGASQCLWDKRIRHLLIGSHSSTLHEGCIQFLVNRGYRIQYENFEPAHQPDGIIHAVAG